MSRGGEYGLRYVAPRGSGQGSTVFGTLHLENLAGEHGLRYVAPQASLNAREHGLRYDAPHASLNPGGLGPRCLAVCSVCRVVLALDEIVKGKCCECWFRDCPLSVHEDDENDFSRGDVLNEGTPPGSARGPSQVADWVLPADFIAFGSLVFPRMTFVENSASVGAVCSVSGFAYPALLSQHSGVKVGGIMSSGIEDCVGRCAGHVHVPCLGNALKSPVFFIWDLELCLHFFAFLHSWIFILCLFPS